jgi:hypothetical protein
LISPAKSSGGRSPPALTRQERTWEVLDISREEFRRAKPACTHATRKNPGRFLKSPAKSSGGRSPPALTRQERTLGGFLKSPAKSSGGRSPPALTRQERTLGGFLKSPAKSSGGAKPACARAQNLDLRSVAISSKYQASLERWPRGRRRRFAKPLYGLKPVSGVRISPSPQNQPRKRSVFFRFSPLEEPVGTWGRELSCECLLLRRSLRWRAAVG